MIMLLWYILRVCRATMCVCNCVCVCVFVCVYVIPLRRPFPMENDKKNIHYHAPQWCYFVPTSLISVSGSMLFHPQRQNSNYSPNREEHNMWRMTQYSDERIYIYMYDLWWKYKKDRKATLIWVLPFRIKPLALAQRGSFNSNQI